MTAGRKREFDKDEALKAAMLVFWEKGYAGTSMADLTARMGINKPSLYATFGNKEQLHRLALELYGQQYGGLNLVHLKDESLPIRQRVENFIKAVTELQFDNQYPTGCLVSSSATESASNNLPEDTVCAVKNMQKLTESSLIECFDQAKAAGELPKDFDSKKKATLIGLLLNGSAVMSRSGKPIEEIRAAIDLSFVFDTD